MKTILGVPDVVSAHPGIDLMGSGCRIDPTLSVMRFGERADVITLGQDVSIYAFNRFVVSDVNADPRVGIRIGAGSILNVGGYFSGEGGLTIGSEVLIGPHVKLLSAGHQIDDGQPQIARNAISRGSIDVGDGAWVGAGAVVLEGVHIGAGAVIAAGSVVRSHVPSGAVVAGVPARFIRWRRGGEWRDASAEGADSLASPNASWVDRCMERLKARFIR